MRALVVLTDSGAWRTVLGVLMVVHGLLTVVIWAPSPKADAPMSTGRSWLFGEARTLSVVLAIVAGVLIAASGAGLLGHQEWWSLAGIAGGVLSLALFLLFFSPWWLGAIVISGTLVFLAVRDRLPA